jgi:hypothetical protein
VGLLKKIIRKIVNRAGEIILDADSQNIERYLYKQSLIETADFAKKNLFNAIPFDNKFKILDYALKQATNDGLFLEFGVFKGETINFISSKVKNTIYGFDSFEGLPEDWREGFEKGSFATKIPKVNPNVNLIKGWFDNTLPEFLKEHEEKCYFIHIDCDLYSSTKIIFDLLKDRIEDTVIVFDEFFNYPGWLEGEYKAFNEFINKSNGKYTVEYIAYNKFGEQLAVHVKNNNRIKKFRHKKYFNPKFKQNQEKI